MTSLNKVMLIGHLGTDPELKITTSGGKKIATFKLSTNEIWFDKNGEKRKDTEWHKVVVWGRLAEICMEYLYKGKLVYIEGKLHTSFWLGRDDVMRFSTEIIAKSIQMIDSPNGFTRELSSEEEYPARSSNDDVPLS